jgi:hypothetical protein
LSSTGPPEKKPEPPTRVKPGRIKETISPTFKGIGIVNVSENAMVLWTILGSYESEDDMIPAAAARK